MKCQLLLVIWPLHVYSILMLIKAFYFDFFINFILSLNLKVRHVTEFLASILVIYIPFSFPWQFYTDKNHGILGKQTERHLFQLLTDFLTKKLRIWITILLLFLCTVIAPIYSLITSSFSVSPERSLWVRGPLTFLHFSL